MELVIIANENTVRDKVFAKYKNVAAFSLAKGLTGSTVDDRNIEYEKLNFLPDDDTINAVNVPVGSVMSPSSSSSTGPSWSSPPSQAMTRRTKEKWQML